jgi:hypothetical protein
LSSDLQDLANYVDVAIDRLANVPPSHGAGIFNKAAQGFERSIVSYAVAVTGDPKLSKRTLGQVLSVLEWHPSATVEPMLTIIAVSKEANGTWVSVKHGTETPVHALRTGLLRIQTALRALPKRTA